ncbi:MAG TPA: SLBB domain-containing protein [Burkholderiaceae bacterium]|jgi:protein involved in polysaccharide export with SLBB domain
MLNDLQLVLRVCTFSLAASITFSAYAQQIPAMNGSNDNRAAIANNADGIGTDDFRLPANKAPTSNSLLDSDRAPNANQLRGRLNSSEDIGNQDGNSDRRIKPLKEIGLDATEFQRFVTETTGRRLPLFGYTLFNGQQNTFVPIQNIPVPADYVLGPGDEVTGRVWGSIDSPIRATIDRNGQVSIPKIGTFTLAGVRASELESVLKAQIGRQFTNFSLSASLGTLRSIQIYVVGQARQPGVYTLSSLSTFVSALFASNGPAANGSMRNIQLKRDGKIIATMDLYAFITQGDKSQDRQLLPGDVIVIPPAGPRVAVLGALDAPGIYELQSSNESMKQVLAYAGGTRALTSPHKVLLERIAPDQFKAPRSVEERTLDEQGLASTLQDGDLITLFKITPKFSNAVTLRGNVANPLRYSYKPGMTLSDLLPEKEALLTPEYFSRKNALVEYEKPRRNNVTGQMSDRDRGGYGRDERNGQEARGDQTTDDQKSYENKRSVNLEQASDNVKNLVDEPNWDYAIIERMNSKDLSVQVISFNLGELVLKKNPKENLALQPGDIVTIFSKKDIQTPLNKRTSLVRVEGEVNAPGIYQIEPGETLQHLLGRVGGLTPQAYLYGAVFTREETRKDQEKNLEIAISKLEQNLNAQMATSVSNASGGTDTKSFAEILAAQNKAQVEQLRSMRPTGRIAMELQPGIRDMQELPDLPLEDGDAIVVPPKPGYITAVGAVDNSNAVIWKLGRTVADTLRTVGVQRDAEKDEIFVLRADGSVAKNGDGWFSSSIDSLPLMPGDTVVVPEKLDKRSAMTQLISGLKDWSQIISQFGLGVAAIKVLK